MRAMVTSTLSRSQKLRALSLKRINRANCTRAGQNSFQQKTNFRIVSAAMSFRFRRTFSLLPGLRANITKTGASLSIGPRGAKLTVGSGGVRATAGLPGTGMFWSEQVTHKGHADAGQSAEPQLSLPPEVEEVIRERPPHWEFLVLQRALRFASNDINTMAAVSASHGTD